MKLFLNIIITFFITSALGVQAVTYDMSTKAKLTDMGFFEGDIRENILIDQGNMYVVIHNPTELALTVMEQGAKNYCRTKLGNDNYTSNFMQILGRYTAYFSCEMQNKSNQYNLSDLERECLENTLYKNDLCENKNITNIVNDIKLQKANEEKYKTIGFINSARTKNYDEIKVYEEKAEKIRIKNIIEIQKTNIESNKEICKGYNFNEGSQLYGECILKLIEINK